MLSGVFQDDMQVGQVLIEHIYFVREHVRKAGPRFVDSMLLTVLESIMNVSPDCLVNCRHKVNMIDYGHTNDFYGF